MPEAGKPLTIADVEEIIDAIATRNHNFPGEPIEMTMMLVMFNIGDRYASVSCLNGEWEGLKKDIPISEGLPMCPEGHVLMQGPSLRLGWLSE